MRQVGFARCSNLPLVFLGGKNICAADQIKIVLRMVLGYFGKNVLETNHGFSIIECVKGQRGNGKRPSERSPKAFDQEWRVYLLSISIPPGPVFFSEFFFRTAKALLDQSS